MSEVLRLGEGESKSGGQQRPSILADALEALIGAVYLDAGYEQAEALVHRLFQEVEIDPHMQAVAEDPRRLCRNGCRAANEAAAVPRGWPPWAKPIARPLTWNAILQSLGLTERGMGGFRRAGEQAAAAAMLATLKAKKL